MDRMNASDIVKNRQNKVLYKAYYQPTVFQSTVAITSSLIISYTTNPNPPLYHTDVITAYNYSCQPTFLSYELLNEVKNGKEACTNACATQVTWSNLTSTTKYMYSTIYSTLSTPCTIIVTSTVVQGNKGPVICPLINFYQGTNADSSYPTWNEPNVRY
jgi:hypothetical protein